MPAPDPAEQTAKPCTCHPDDNPPAPCPQRYALSECVVAAEPAPRSPDLNGMSVGELSALLCSAMDGGRLHGVIVAELERRIAAEKDRADAAERELSDQWSKIHRAAEHVDSVEEQVTVAYERYDAVRTERDAAIAERDKLAKFKAWVHEYLDAHGVPYHPPGTHGAAGCRIGDRMDWLMSFTLAPTPTPKAGDK